MEIKLYRQYWVGLAADVRDKLVNLFGIRRDEGTEVIDGKLVSDGHSDAALSGINVESMQKVLGSKEKDFTKLFNLVLQSLVEEPKIEVYNEPMTEEDKKIMAAADEKPVKKTKKIK